MAHVREYATEENPGFDEPWMPVITSLLHCRNVEMEGIEVGTDVTKNYLIFRYGHENYVYSLSAAPLNEYAESERWYVATNIFLREVVESDWRIRVPEDGDDYMVVIRQYAPGSESLNSDPLI